MVIDEWIHWALVVDQTNSKAKLYKNGVKFSEVNSLGGVPNTSRNSIFIAKSTTTTYF